MFFTYDQNNSGGSFDFSEWKCTQTVIVEADSSKEADEIAESIGLYFDGEEDCDCCGPRWYSAWRGGDQFPSVYGTPVWRYYANTHEFNINWMGDQPDAFVHYKDGTVEAWKHGQALKVKESK